MKVVDWLPMFWLEYVCTGRCCSARVVGLRSVNVMVRGVARAAVIFGVWLLLIRYAIVVRESGSECQYIKISSGKSLTQPPGNLKEAIDWVLRVSGRDNGQKDNGAIKGLAKELIKLLDKDGSTLASEVSGIFSKARSGLQSAKQKDAREAFMLNAYLSDITRYGRTLNDEELDHLKTTLQKDVSHPGELSGGPISQLAEGMKKFIGYQGNGKPNGNSGIGCEDYESSYNSATERWSSLNPSQHRICALILLGIMPLLYFGLSYLYWLCTEEEEGGKDPRWSNLKINGSGNNQDALKKFLEKVGFSDTSKLNSSKTGQNIVSFLKSGFTELKSAKAASNSYATFLSELQKAELKSSSTSFPLISLYLISYYYITYPLYTVESTTPATPSFAGYSGVGALAGGAYGFNLGGLGTFMSALLAYPFILPCQPLVNCPPNLKEAIDWILRVTGKDGQDSGTNGTDALTEHVQKLLQGVEVSDVGLSAYIGKVTQALDSSGDNLITKLADGLQQFIGYQSCSNPHGHITGAGIAPSNIATHRLCDATIAFTIGVLESLSRDRSIKEKDKKEINTVISELNGAFGKSVNDGLKKVAGTINTTLGRVTGNDGVVQAVKAVGKAFHSKLSNAHNTSAKTLADKVGQYLDEVFTDKNFGGSANQVTAKLQALFQSFTTDDTVYNAIKLSTQIDGVKDQLSPPRTSGFAKPILEAGKSAFIRQLGNKNKYKSYYDNPSTAKWSQNNEEQKRCAQIFLGCLPLYYQALTYIYWGCHDKGGGWRNLTLAGGDLKSYFDSQGLLPLYVDRSKRGAHIGETALGGFSEFGTAAASSRTGSTFTYVSFTKELQDKVTTNIGTRQNLPTTCPLSALYYGASCYFQCQQIKNAKEASRTPRTIREMLYFLAAVPYSSYYDAFDSYVTSHFRTLLGKESDVKDDSELKLQVADSGTSATGNTLSAADVKSYLTSTFHLAPAFIGLVQEPSTSGEPWLHSLFSNTDFNFKYSSSGATLFYALADYAYALQFQLHFLYQQCSNNGVKCGWQECRYGKGITGSGTSSLKSHICPGFKCDNGNCNHKSSGNCKHNNYEQDDGCGKSAATASPLQAFLTDKLDGFHLSLQPIADSPNHLENHPPGFMCHVPMGFAGALTKDTNATGWYIYYLLDHFCSRPYSPLRQLSEKLGCLTKRTPRTLGDLFGFIWTLNYQLFNNADILNKLREALNQKPNSVEEFMGKLKQSVPILKPSPEGSGLVKSLQTMAPTIPFLYQLFTVNTDDFLPVTLFNLAQHCHKVENSNGSFKILHNNSSSSSFTSSHNCSSSPNDLWSLYQPVSAAPTGRGMTDSQSACRGAKCGGYLYPLTYSAGTTYAPVHASVYLSWLAYLTDDFHEWFQNLLDEFKNIDCKVSGCRGTNGKTCSEPHAPGTHGSDQSCQCDSVVHCGGVLPVLYRHGFSFHNAYSLKGGMHGSDPTKRSCQQFNKQLTAVLAQNENAPLFKLLTTIDDFLYMFRFYFFYNLSTFWIMYVCIVLYNYLFKMDSLHIKSHLHLPSSHTVPPIGLLTTGKAPALTKFTYYVP
ncbi:extracellular matrix-binding ebh [Babesia caballi]|uniref:Extracellular matrix-binding ebh n=1 Tax=Babesia caballi TaxID=5871 RepID=A0AAV4LNL4_BABCB|nr:extracellular matrix-binding ebh [Babesia caballi]